MKQKWCKQIFWENQKLKSENIKDTHTHTHTFSKWESAMEINFQLLTKYT